MSISALLKGFEKRLRSAEVFNDLPARPIVPPDGEIPVAWEEPIEAAMQQGLERVIEVMCNVGGIP